MFPAKPYGQRWDEDISRLALVWICGQWVVVLFLRIDFGIYWLNENYSRATTDSI